MPRNCSAAPAGAAGSGGASAVPKSRGITVTVRSSTWPPAVTRMVWAPAEAL